MQHELDSEDMADTLSLRRESLPSARGSAPRGLKEGGASPLLKSFGLSVAAL
jgi:hypothetical protein